jgi:hypothetical protein
MASIINKSEKNSSQKNFQSIKWKRSKINRKNSQLPIFKTKKNKKFRAKKTVKCKR